MNLTHYQADVIVTDAVMHVPESTKISEFQVAVLAEDEKDATKLIQEFYSARGVISNVVNGINTLSRSTRPNVAGALRTVKVTNLSLVPEVGTVLEQVKTVDLRTIPGANAATVIAPDASVANLTNQGVVTQPSVVVPAVAVTGNLAPAPVEALAKPLTPAEKRAATIAAKKVAEEANKVADLTPEQQAAFENTGDSALKTGTEQTGTETGAEGASTEGSAEESTETKE